MRELTPEESALRDRVRARFDAFLAERMPVLADFAEALGLPDPPLIVAEPESYLGAIDEFMRGQTVGSEDRVWIRARIGYYIGELLIGRFGGCWFVNETPDTRFFLKYVVGKFTRIRNPRAMVDPFEVAVAYLSEPPGRSLTRILDEVGQELRNS